MHALLVRDVEVADGGAVLVDDPEAQRLGPRRGAARAARRRPAGRPGRRRGRGRRRARWRCGSDMWPSGSAVRAVGSSPCGSIAAPASAAPPNSSGSAATKAAMRSRAVRGHVYEGSTIRGRGMWRGAYRIPLGGYPHSCGWAAKVRPAQGMCDSLLCAVRPYPTGTDRVPVRYAAVESSLLVAPPVRRAAADRARPAREGARGDGAGRRREGLRGRHGRRRRAARARLARHLLRALRLQGGLPRERLPARLRGARGAHHRRRARGGGLARGAAPRPARLPADARGGPASSPACTCSSGRRSRPSARRR